MVNESLSIFDLVTNASTVVQAVMAILVLASLISWVMIFQRGFTLAGISRDAIQFENDFYRVIVIYSLHSFSITTKRTIKRIQKQR